MACKAKSGPEVYIDVVVEAQKDSVSARKFLTQTILMGLFAD